MRLLIVQLTVLFVFCTFPVQGGAQSSTAVSSVLLEAPKPLGDIRSLRRDPDLESYVPVGKRVQRDFATQPIRWHGFLLTPQIVSEQKIDSNILASSENDEADTITVVRPSLQVRKEFGRHSANLLVEGEGEKFWSNQENDVFNARAQLSGVLEARRSFKIPFELSYTSGHEKRSQNFSQNISEEPIGFTSMGGALGFVYKPNRASLSVVGRHAEIAFDNGRTVAGNRLVREDDDRTSTTVEVRGSYDLTPNHVPFVSVGLGELDYDQGTFDGTGFNGPERDSENLNVVVGWQFGYKGLLLADIGVGYTSRDYDSQSIEDIETTGFAADINWNMTKRSTFNLGLRRSITDNNDSTQGVILTEARLGYDREVLHNLFFDAFINYALLDVSDTDREDDVISGGFGMRYDLSPRFAISAGYDYTTRESTAPGLDYDRHQLTARLTTKF